MKNLFQNSLYRFDLLQEQDQFPILFFDWMEETTSALTYEDFQDSCHNFAGFAWQYQSQHLLVDTRSFHLQLPAEFDEWREQHLNPRFHQLGVLKFAYIARPEFIQYMKDIPAQDGKFETRHFVSKEEALTWLTQSR